MKLVVCLIVAAFLGRSQSPDAATTPPSTAPLTVEEIMARVAANQDRAEKARTGFVYEQHIKVSSRHTNGKLAREEVSDFLVTPTETGVDKKLEKISGSYWHKGSYLTYEEERPGDGEGLDGSLVRDFRDDLANDKSKDGLAKDLFPLTSEEQKQYKFTLAGTETRQDRTVYRITFRPADKDDLDWAGEAVVDAAEFQPITVDTKLSRRLPFFVRTMLGTDVPGLGFSVRYQRQADGVWFPVSFGTEFRLRAVFFINRNLALSLENKNFRHTNVESAIEYKTDQTP
ncbi:MAG: hypothetical protein WBW33_13560 [Bryobacteraceae bacterium]